MTAETTDIDEAPKKRSGKGLLIGLVFAVLLGGGGFYAVWSGLILGQDNSHESEVEPIAQGALPDVLFLA
ncbi:MAG: flagellar basal body protein FliL, partial [Paracoccaceae bacterium]